MFFLCDIQSFIVRMMKSQWATSAAGINSDSVVCCVPKRAASQAFGFSQKFSYSFGLVLCLLLQHLVSGLDHFDCFNNSCAAIGTITRGIRGVQEPFFRFSVVVVVVVRGKQCDCVDCKGQHLKCLAAEGCQQ